MTQQDKETLEVVESSIAEAHDFIFGLNEIEKLGYAKNYILEVMKDIKYGYGTCEYDLDVDLDVAVGILNYVIEEMMKS